MTALVPLFHAKATPNDLTPVVMPVLNTAADAVRFNSELARKASAGELNPTQVSALKDVAAAFVTTLNLVNLEARVAELEQLMEPHKPR
jgi:hypothetical protein